MKKDFGGKEKRDIKMKNTMFVCAQGLGGKGLNIFKICIKNSHSKTKKKLVSIGKEFQAPFVKHECLAMKLIRSRSCWGEAYPES